MSIAIHRIGIMDKGICCGIFKIDSANPMPIILWIRFLQIVHDHFPSFPPRRLVLRFEQKHEVLNRQNVKFRERVATNSVFAFRWKDGSFSNDIASRYSARRSIVKVDRRITSSLNIKFLRPISAGKQTVSLIARHRLHFECNLTQNLSGGAPEWFEEVQLPQHELPQILMNVVLKVRREGPDQIAFVKDVVITAMIPNMRQNGSCQFSGQFLVIAKSLSFLHFLVFNGSDTVSLSDQWRDIPDEIRHETGSYQNGKGRNPMFVRIARSRHHVAIARRKQLISP